MFRQLFGRGPVTLEQKLAVLARCGLALAPPFTAEDLLRSWPRAAFEKPGFDLTLVGLAMTEEKPPWRNHCTNVWHFDTECIEDEGAYCRIAERMSEMAQGSLPLKNIRDHVDLENETAWLEFEYGGERVHIDCKVKDDWVDETVFGHFVKLLARSDPNKIYAYYDLHGQDCVIACVTQGQLAQLRKAGLAFVPLQ